MKQLLEGEEPGVQVVLKYPEKFLEELEGEKGHPLMVHHDAEWFLPGDERRQFGEKPCVVFSGIRALPGVEVQVNPDVLERRCRFYVPW